MFYTGSAVNAHTPVNSISNFQIKINRLSSVFFMNFDTQRHSIFYIFDKSHQKGLFFDYIGNGKQKIQALGGNIIAFARGYVHNSAQHISHTVHYPL